MAHQSLNPISKFKFRVHIFFAGVNFYSSVCIFTTLSTHSASLEIILSVLFRRQFRCVHSHTSYSHDYIQLSETCPSRIVSHSASMITAYRSGPDTKDPTHKEDLRNGTFVTLKPKIFLATSSQSDQLSQSDCLFLSAYEEVSNNVPQTISV